MMFIAEDLYKQILRSMPIPCVDLLVTDEKGNVLLLRRKNEPAAGQWWFPGGRVLIGEKREDAAKRKLEEECGLFASKFIEDGTFDIVFNLTHGACIHSITTLFSVQVLHEDNIQLDHQSHEAGWHTPSEWLKCELHPFVGTTLGRHISHGQSNCVARSG